MAVREGENSRGSTKCLEHFGPPKAPEGAGTWMCLRQSRPNTMTVGYPKRSLVLGFLYMAVREGENSRGSTKCLEHFGPPKAPEGAGTWKCLRQSRPNTMTVGYPKPSLVLGFLYMAVREGENSRGSTKCLEHFGPPKAPEGLGTWMCLRQSRPNTMTVGYPKPSLVLGFFVYGGEGGR